MPSAADRLEFAPPAPPGMLRAFILAVSAHILLLAALTWGVSWKREADTLSAEAELWAATPQQAAPKLVEAPAPAPPPPAPVAKVEPPAPMPREADIALEREKKRKEQEKLREQELERQKKLDAQKKLAEQKKQDELKKQELAKKAAEDKKKAEAAKATQTAKAQEDAKKVEEARRQENLKRMQGLAGGTGAPSSTGTAQRSAGPSDSYGGRIRAKVRPNIVFTEDITGNPLADVEVRLAPDGTIIGKRITKSSGVKSWDEAVLRALDKTEVLPRDIDGRVPASMTIGFRPKD